MSSSKIVSNLFYNSNETMSLGCTNCLEKDICGGLRTANLFNCMNFCCNNPNSCEYVCVRDIESFVGFANSVRGFDLNNLPQAQTLTHPQLPLFVPLIYHSSSRTQLLEVDAVAIKLNHLFDQKTGLIKFESREELSDFYGFSPSAKLIITGVDGDAPLENYWLLSRKNSIAAQLVALQPDLVTTPNFSAILDAPRWDNLYNLKRLVISWREFVEVGIPTSLHLNARTDRDWERLTEFIGERPEVKSVSFEFATGAAFKERGEWYAKKLSTLALHIQRDIQLVVRGGYKFLNTLYNSYLDLVFIDTTCFMKSINRHKLMKIGGKTMWVSIASPDLIYIDDLLEYNIRTRSKAISAKVSSNL